PSCCLRPDDEIAPGLGTWREYLIQYNQQGSNPHGLYRAADLYKPHVYRDLVKQYGWNNVFILSAGWGLIRSDYLTPYYDITFSKQGKPWAIRRPDDHYQDFNHLQEAELSEDERIYFFGGKDYLPLYYSLTEHIPGRKVIYHSQASLEVHEGYEYVIYRSHTNWHYSCAQAFIADRVPK
ncbi:MAG: hypothetical protein ACRD5H_19170, partial [Nitrososphaerales archaeon]